MSKIDGLVEKTKNIAYAAGKHTSDFVDKAKPGAEKVLSGIKDKTEDILKKRDKVKTGAIERADKLLNTVIDGAYKECIITEKKGVVSIDEKEVSRMNCESYEANFESETVASTKIFFEEFRKRSNNPINKMKIDNYLQIAWRTGDKSIVCVDSSKYALIVKTLS